MKHHFVAEFENELGLNEGDMVYLLRYVDNEWLEAELDSNHRYVFLAAGVTKAALEVTFLL